MTPDQVKVKFHKILDEVKSEGKSQATMENVIFLLNPRDISLCHALTAWKNIGVRVDYDTEYEEMEDDWDWIWQFCVWDQRRLAAVSGMKTSQIIACHNQLYILRLIYPDGTVNEYAQGVVRSMVKQQIGRLMGGGSSMPPPSTPKSTPPTGAGGGAGAAGGKE